MVAMSLSFGNFIFVAGNSVTRLGEISPLWQNFKSLLLFFARFLVFGKILNLLWLIFLMSKYLVTLAGIYTAKLFKSISGSCLELQCDQIWQNFATLNTVKNLGHFQRVLSVFCNFF